VDSCQPIGDVLAGHTYPVTHVVFSPDGLKLASASSDDTLRLWDVETTQPIGDALKGHTDWVNHVAFSPDGKKLVSASDDNTLRLWDVDGHQPIGDAFRGHTDWVDRVAFSPNGQTLASSSHDNTLRLWDVETGQMINQLHARLSPSAFESCRPLLLSFDSQGFLQHPSKRLLWLPVPLRGCIAFSSSSVVVGSPTGAVTFIRWPVPLSAVGMHKQICQYCCFLGSAFSDVDRLLQHRPHTQNFV
jgi:WD40 repeat protein